MTIGLDVAVRNNQLNQIRNAIDAGGAAGTLSFYTGPRPATGAAIGAEVLLGTVTFAYPSAPDAASGVLTFSAIVGDTSADNTGTAVWARAATSAGAFVADLSVGATGSGEDIELNNTSITAGGTIDITSGTITAGNA